MRIADARTPLGVVAMLLAACVLAFVCILSGCASTPNPVPTTATPTAAPVFATEEEALAAATEAYAAYLAVADEVSISGGENPERYELVAAGQALADAQLSAEQYRESQAHRVGSMSFSVESMQSVEPGEDNATHVTLYLCDDVSEVDVLGPDGRSLVSPDRPDRTPFQVTLSFQPADTTVLQAKTLWTGVDFC